MARTPEELIKQLDELKRLQEKAEQEYNTAISAEFKKHKACCPDICTIINDAISKININITKATDIKKRTSNNKIEKALSKNILTAESQLKKLKDLKEEIYAKHVCNCS